MAGTAAGRLKQKAIKAGLSVEEYLRRTDAGLKRCSACHQWKMAKDDFARNPAMRDGRANACKECSNHWHRRHYTPAPPRSKGKFRSAPRDGDSGQAKHRVNYRVDIGLLPPADSLPCSRCGHIGSDKKHNYHHDQGYQANHHLSVIVLCVGCHRSTHGATRRGECSPHTTLVCKRCGKRFRVLDSYLKLHGVQEHCSLECRYGHSVKGKNGWGHRKSRTPAPTA